MAKRPTIGDNPLDAVIPASAPLRPTAAAPAPERESARPPSGRKIRATFHIPERLLEEARDAAVALSGPPHRLTLAALAENALVREVERLRREHNGGAEFPTREPGSLRGGRPIGS